MQNADDFEEVPAPASALRRDIPLFGSMPAGFPSDNPQFVERFIPIPKGKKHPPDAFALRVRGDAMIGKDINNGDTVVVHKRDYKTGA